MSERKDSKGQRGLGLLEILVGFVIVGIITLVAVPMIKSLTSNAADSTAKRNAQTICQLYNGARGVGVVFSSPSKAGIVQELVVGIEGPELTGSFFQMPPLSGTELVGALRHCKYDPVTDQMRYSEEGGEEIEMALVQDIAAAEPRKEPPAAVGITPAPRENHAKWEKLPTWFTNTRQESERVVEYIRQNPQMTEMGIRFGEKEWRVGQGERGFWWAEFRAK